MPDTTPKPGSNAAIDSGCTCPVMDNRYGEGIPLSLPDGTVHHAFWISSECPLHGDKNYPEVVEEQQGN